jgi:hypothetical protein
VTQSTAVRIAVEATGNAEAALAEMAKQAKESLDREWAIRYMRGGDLYVDDCDDLDEAIEQLGWLSARGATGLEIVSRPRPADWTVDADGLPVMLRDLAGKAADGDIDWASARLTLAGWLPRRPGSAAREFYGNLVPLTRQYMTAERGDVSVRDTYPDWPGTDDGLVVHLSDLVDEAVRALITAGR